MPHVTVQLWPDHSEATKQDLADRITQAVMDSLGSSAESVSVAIEEVPASRWMADVYRPEIEPNMDRLYKRPGYKPF